MELKYYVILCAKPIYKNVPDVFIYDINYKRQWRFTGGGGTGGLQRPSNKPAAVFFSDSGLGVLASFFSNKTTPKMYMLLIMKKKIIIQGHLDASLSMFAIFAMYRITDKLSLPAPVTSVSFNESTQDTCSYRTTEHLYDILRTRVN